MKKMQIRPSGKIRTLVLVALVAAMGSAYGPSLAQPQTSPPAPAPAGVPFLTLRDAAQMADAKLSASEAELATSEERWLELEMRREEIEG